jgi:hypothetical protein
VDCINRTGVYARTAVDAGIGVDYTLVTCFTDCIYRAGIIACTAVDALFANRVSQGGHLLRCNVFMSWLIFLPLTYGGKKVQKKGFCSREKVKAEKILN